MNKNYFNQYLVVYLMPCSYCVIVQNKKYNNFVSDR